MRPYCVEFSDGTVWVGMADSTTAAGRDASAYWHEQVGSRCLAPTFSVYHLDVEDAE